MAYKNIDQQVKSLLYPPIPEDIKKGFYDLGYNDDEINKQFDYHKKELVDPDEPRDIPDDDVFGYMRDHLKDKLILPYKKPFTPTKTTIWDDPNHPLYGIAPSEQNEEFLNDAIREIARNTESPESWKAYGGASGGGSRLDAIKKLNQYKKALKYIKGE